MAARHQSRPQLSSGRISTHPIFLNLITGNQVEKINLGQNPVHEQLQPSCLLKLTSDHPTPRLKPLWGLGIEFQRHLVAWKVLQDQPTPLTPAGTSFPPRPVAVRSRYPALWSIFSVLHGCGGFSSSALFPTRNTLEMPWAPKNQPASLYSSQETQPWKPEKKPHGQSRKLPPVGFPQWHTSWKWGSLWSLLQARFSGMLTLWAKLEVRDIDTPGTKSKVVFSLDLEETSPPSKGRCTHCSS